MSEASFSLTALVLVGGKSLRMGSDKAHLPHPETGEPLLLRQLSLLLKLGPKQRLVSAREDQLLPPLPADVRRIDDNGKSGPLAGIVNALHAISTTHILVLAVDLPDMDVASLQRLTAVTGPNRGAIAETSFGLEPLIAIYPKTLLPAFAQALENGRFGLRRLIGEPSIKPHLNMVRFPSNSPALRNWNTPA